MNCREFVEFILDFVEDELPPDVLRRFEVHIQKCPPCLEYLESYRLSIQLGRKCCCDELEPPGDMPPELIQSILKARRGAH